MFYSQLLLSKKGALGIIWMAAHCHKRLKKDQVQQTNISSSVDKILYDEVPVVTHRILAFLLLGVVRIYSKKVEYLFDDCHEVLNRLCSSQSSPRKSARAEVGVSPAQRRYESIILPTRFELDTFDLGLPPDATGGKVRAREQETHPDGLRKGFSKHGSFLKAHMDNVLIPEASTTRTPPRDVLRAHRMDQDLLVKPSSNMNISLAGVEILRRTYRPLEDCVDPIQLDETEDDQMHCNISNEDWRTNSQGPTNDMDSDSDSAVRLSNIRCHSLRSLGLNLMVLDESEKAQQNYSPSHYTASPTFRGRIPEKQMHRNLSEMLGGIGFTLDDRLEPMVLDEAEQEQLYHRPSSKNTSPNVQGNSVENQSHERSNPVENMDILHEGNFSSERSPNFKVSNSAEKREGQDKPTNEDHGAKEQHMDHLSTQLNIQEEQMHDNLSGSEMLHGIGFTLEDRLEPVVLDEAEKEQLRDKPTSKSTTSNVQGPIQYAELNSVENQSHGGSDPGESMEILHGPKEKHIDHLITQLNSQEGADKVFTETVDNAGPVGPELEVITPDSVKCHKPENFRVSILNPHSKLPADVGTVEVAAVPTPGRKERSKILKKRKTLLDDATVVPNKVLRSWIEEDPTDLKRVRTNVPRTLLQVWRAHKLCHAPHSFLDPSIPGVSVDFGYHGCLESCAPEIISSEPSAGQEQVPDIRSHVTEKSPRQTPDVRSPVAENSSGQTAGVTSMVVEKPPEEAPVVRSPDIRSHVTEKSPRKTPDVRSPVAESSSGQTASVTSMVVEKPPKEAPVVRSLVAENYSDQPPIAPGTPAAHLNSFRSREAETIADSGILEPSLSLQSVEKCSPSNGHLGLDALFQEETSLYEGNSLEKDEFSARTRTTAHYLGRKFLHKKRRKEEEVLNLSCLLAGKTKKESTVMFYEILVLKTRDCIDVQQETAYQDILMRETPKLRQYFQMSME